MEEDEKELAVVDPELDDEVLDDLSDDEEDAERVAKPVQWLDKAPDDLSRSDGRALIIDRPDGPCGVDANHPSIQDLLSDEPWA